MRQHKVFQKALKTNKISKDEAVEFLDDLTKWTENHIKTKYSYYYNKKMYPIKAQVAGKGQKSPIFIVNHHTGAKHRGHGGAMSRFFTSAMASANFIITNEGEMIYLVSVDNMAYHATKRTFIPLSVRRFLKIDDGRWLNECGLEIVNNGMVKLFRLEQFETSIALQRILNAYFGYSLKELKSHKFFSPTERSGDPGFCYYLPLVEHAVLNDYDIQVPVCWLYEYKEDPVKFANNGSINWIKNLNLISRDEWWDKRNKMVGKITNEWLL